MKIHLVREDITTLKVDVVVNAANNTLLGGGGVDGAIHRAGGPEILEECRKIRARQGGCPTGEAVITTAGNMPSEYVIHTVGPVWNGGGSDKDQLLRNAYENSLKLAEEHSLRSIAFPNISTGVYGFPKDQAAKIAVSAVRNFEANTIKAVYFVCFDEENYSIYDQLLNG